MSERTMRSAPRYQIEERSPALPATIVGFVNTPRQYQSLVARHAVRADVVVIDQDSEAVNMRRTVWVVPES
jgi:hypothetical protein